MMATESTPLLNGGTAETRPNEAGDTLPFVSVALRRARSLGDYRLLYLEDIAPTLTQPHLVPERYSFGLLVLLKLRQSRISASSTSFDIWEHYSQERSADEDVRVLEERIDTLYDAYLREYRSYRDLERILWTPFPVDEDSKETTRVADCLTESNPPSTLLRNAVVMQGFESLWKHGFYTDIGTNASIARRMLVRWDSTKPRVSHFMSLVSKTIYFVFLAHFVLSPPLPLKDDSNGYSYSQTPDAREIVLLVISFSYVLRRPSLLSLSYLIILISFLAKLPYTVYEKDIAFDFILIGFLLQFVQFHIPRYPSPIFMAPKPVSLPLSVFLSRGLSHVTFPVVSFFLPALLVALLLLSVSMKDYPFLYTYPVVSPIKTRDMLLVLGVCLLVCLVCSLVLVGMSPATQHRTRNSWDRFGLGIGVDSRALFVSALVTYAEPYYFPPPLNLLPLFTVWLPKAVLPTRTHPVFNFIERALWRISVGPLNAVINTILWVFSRNGFLRSIGI